MENSQDKAICRGCGKILNGKPYYTGGSAYHPITNEPCPINQYGGYVCSYSCDKRASMELEGSMPGSNKSQTLSIYAQNSLKRNWPNF